MALVCDIRDIAYHRNGICGAPFHVVLFVDSDHGDMVGIVFEEPQHVAVLNIRQTAHANITFANGNSWRGDHYEPILRHAIAQWEKERYPEPAVQP